tara:strand:+ start:1042 stop:1149 length:108 start_codon:yes stop_codon:yes gene_type:complete
MKLGVAAGAGLLARSYMIGFRSAEDLTDDPENKDS